MWHCHCGNDINPEKKTLGGDGGTLWQMPAAVKHFCQKETEAGLVFMYPFFILYLVLFSFFSVLTVTSVCFLLSSTCPLFSSFLLSFLPLHVFLYFPFYLHVTISSFSLSSLYP